jgi:hypothetical protein
MMQSIWHDIPKHHRERTWSIYGKSVPQLFIERAAARSDAVALRYKDFGLYQEITWRKDLARNRGWRPDRHHGRPLLRIFRR